MTDTDIRAMVQIGPSTLELQHLEKPVVGDDEALIRVEACCVCGSDVSMYRAESHGSMRWEFPIIRGHEPVGVVESIGAGMAARNGLAVGDRVAVDPFLRCGTCRYCLDGLGELCSGGTPGRRNSYAMIPMTEAPGLWGGFATHLLATSQTILYPVPDHVPPRLAALFNALGGSIKWTLDAGGVGLGSTVVVLGSGQRGVGCAVAALAAGASFVAVTGLTQDGPKLRVAEQLGAHLTVDIEQEDVVDAVRAATGGGGVDVVIDTTPNSAQALRDAAALVRPAGTIVVAGLKHGDVDGFPIDRITMKQVTLKGVLGTGADHYRRAIALIASGRFPLDLMQTHVFPLEDVGHAIDVLAGAVPGEVPLSIVVDTA
jgi:threonine dehydrogenase-like Zn-dependent dehydrogenase